MLLGGPCMQHSTRTTLSPKTCVQSPVVARHDVVKALLPQQRKRLLEPVQQHEAGGVGHVAAAGPRARARNASQEGTSSLRRWDQCGMQPPLKAGPPCLPFCPPPH